MPGNMLRTRKKDVNLKPNRILDKRGSRGMLYENEELRIRTIHINDEVEKGHNDIKKLKKENENLKREIWNLRDEYEKLEDMMQGLCANYRNSDGSPQGAALQLKNPLISTARKYRYRRESEATTSMSMYDSDDEELDDMLMIDDDGRSYDSASIIGLAALASKDEIPENESQKSQYTGLLGSPADDYSLDSNKEMTMSTSKPNLYQPAHHHHLWQHLTSVPPDLEVVKEESESMSNSNNQSPLPKSGHSESPNVDNTNEKMDMTCSENIEGYNLTNLNDKPSCPISLNESMTNPFFNPKIEITPARSPTPSTSHTGTGTPPETEVQHQGNTTPDHTTTSTITNVQNLGCVTLIPKKFQVTSQLRISDGQPDSVRTITQSPKNQYDEEDGNSSQCDSKEFTPASITTSSNNTQLHARLLQSLSKQQRASQSVFFHTGKGDQILSSQTLSFPNTTGLLAEPLSPFYQSEPTLSLTNNNATTNSSPEVYLSYEDYERRRGSDWKNSSANSHSPQSFRSNSNFLPVELSSSGSVERYVVIGYIESSGSNLSNSSGSVKCNYKLRDLRAQEIIDELENQFDSALEQIVGVRIMCGSWDVGLERNDEPVQIYISLTNSNAVKSLVDKGLTLTSFKIHVDLIDITTKCSIVTLSGLPSNISDSTIVSTLNQFGQVVAPLERRSYKGVDISERVARMHLVTMIPSIVNIASYQILAKTCDCQEPVEKSTMNVIQPKNPSVTHKSSVPLVIQQQAANECSRSSLTNSISLDKIIRVNQRRLATNAACQEETNKIRLIEDGATSPGGLSSSFVQPSSPSPSIRTNLSLNSVSGVFPTNSQIRAGHRLVSRAVSSAPRLETSSGGNLTNVPFPASAVSKRRMSTCSDISEENVPVGQAHSSRIGSVSLDTNATLPIHDNSKKPLSRLLRSTPGSLVPPDSPYAPSTGGGAASKSFYRSLSFDPRRNSDASRCYGMTVTGEPTTTTVNEFETGMEQQQGNSSGNRLLQSQMSHHSQLESRNMGFGKHQNDTQKSLPWCGCWGNGCI